MFDDINKKYMKVVVLNRLINDQAFLGILSDEIDIDLVNMKENERISYLEKEIFPDELGYILIWRSFLEYTQMQIDYEVDRVKNATLHDRIMKRCNYFYEYYT